MIEVVIVAAKRTPMGGFQGILSPLTATELGAQAIAASLASIGLSAGEPDEVYMGCVLPAGLKQAPARQAAIKAGIPDSAHPSSHSRAKPDEAAPSTTRMGPASAKDAEQRPEKMHISDLQQRLDTLGIWHKDCVEKSELVERYRNSLAKIK